MAHSYCKDLIFTAYSCEVVTQQRTGCAQCCVTCMVDS